MNFTNTKEYRTSPSPPSENAQVHQDYEDQRQDILVRSGYELRTPYQMKIPFVKKFVADFSQTMLAIIRCGILCLPGCNPKI